MKWLVLWVCHVCGHSDIEVRYAAFTEESARSFAEQLWADERTRGSWFIAHIDVANLAHDPVVIWGDQR